MTPLNLQDELVAELSRIFKGFALKGPSGEQLPINVYPQTLPIIGSDEDTDPVPYILAKLQGGSDKGDDGSFNLVRVVIVVTTWDDSPDAQGYRDCLNIIQRIYERFGKNPNLNGVASYSGEFDWMVQEEGYYPYCFAACSISFCIAAVRREDRYI